MQGYFEWLCSLVCPSGGRLVNTHVELLRAMHRKEFYSLVEHDQNRAVDGETLRQEWSYLSGYSEDDQLILFATPASLLEVTVAMARKMAFTMLDEVENSTAERWFWEMMDNAGLTQYTDDVYKNGDKAWVVDDKLEMILSRTYTPHGVGGFFPRKRTGDDLRKQELWQQMNGYLIERY